ncbi:hypothetical protein DFH94DRAFT_89088 [Russula ochroleuca]|jgi:hypothetical protein|uniref:Uncharacterized protein n=1 Tax=Russula ochroleuca TaxID=152965 RepID=A0A9P5T6Y1_9AGAM|nr:hypothetical protein DFH94DRAFT_89088 [Russula ochroleuca]
MEHLKVAFSNTGGGALSYCVANSSDRASKRLHPSTLPPAQPHPAQASAYANRALVPSVKGLAPVTSPPLASLARLDMGLDITQNKLGTKRPISHLQVPMRSDKHINVGRMTEFSFVTWACIYAPVRTEFSVTCHWARARDISYYPFCPSHSHRKASSCSLLGCAVLQGSPRGARHSPTACAASCAPPQQFNTRFSSTLNTCVG